MLVRLWIRSRGQSLWLASFPASWGAWICCQACPRIQSLRWWNEKQWNTFLFNSQCRIRTTVLFFFKHIWLRVELVEFHCNYMAASFVSGPIASFLASIQFVSWCACCPAKRLEFCWRVGGTASQQLRFKAFAAQPRLAIVTKTLALAANDLTHFGIVSWNESCRKMWLVFSVVEPEGKIAKNPRGCFFHFFLFCSDWWPDWQFPAWFARGFHKHSHFQTFLQVFLSIFFTYVAMGMAFFGREVESFASFDRACLALLEALHLAWFSAMQAMLVSSKCNTDYTMI